jgi:hypothetical protein
MTEAKRAERAAEIAKIYKPHDSAFKIIWRRQQHYFAYDSKLQLDCIY